MAWRVWIRMKLSSQPSWNLGSPTVFIGKTENSSFSSSTTTLLMLGLWQFWCDHMKAWQILFFFSFYLYLRLICPKIKAAKSNCQTEQWRIWKLFDFSLYKIGCVVNSIWQIKRASWFCFCTSVNWNIIILRRKYHLYRSPQHALTRCRLRRFDVVDLALWPIGQMESIKDWTAFPAWPWSPCRAVNSDVAVAFIYLFISWAGQHHLN